MRMILSAWEDQVLALWKYQRVNGAFTTLIDVEETYCETSATAAIAYGVLKGVRMGVLTEARYIELGHLAAQYVLSQIDATGAVQGVSGGTGMGYTLQQCVGCGKCEQHCPQGIPIREKLKEADRELRPLPYRIGIGLARKIMFRKVK